MSKIISTLISLLFLCLITVAQNNTKSPTIVSTSIKFGDCNVSVDTKEILIEFDTEMQAGFSMPDTRDMPEFTGKLQWINTRTLSVPVRLEADKLYHLLFNSQKFNNFRSVEGIPLEPKELIFKTASVNYSELNVQAYEELFTYLPHYYSYAEFKEVDWEKELKSKEYEFKNSASNIDFGIHLLDILKKADDIHFSIDIKGQRFYSGLKKITTPNYIRSNAIFKMLDDARFANTFQFVAGRLNNVGYISIKNWNFSVENMDISIWGSKDSTIQLIDLLSDMDTLPNLIIDVRENSGGNEFFAKQFASYFTKDTIPYEKIVVRDSITNKYNVERLKYLNPNFKNINYKGNIYILSGPDVMSSNESFVLMMQQLPNVKVVGMKSYGSSGNPIPIQLANHIKLYIPSWQAYTLNGELIEGNGIQPDIEFVSTHNNTLNKESHKTNQVDELLNNVLKLTKKN